GCRAITRNRRRVNLVHENDASLPPKDRETTTTPPLPQSPVRVVLARQFKRRLLTRQQVSDSVLEHKRIISDATHRRNHRVSQPLLAVIANSDPPKHRLDATVDRPIVRRVSRIPSRREINAKPNLIVRDVHENLRRVPSLQRVAAVLPQRQIRAPTSSRLRVPVLHMDAPLSRIVAVGPRQFLHVVLPGQRPDRAARGESSTVPPAHPDPSIDPSLPKRSN